MTKDLKYVPQVPKTFQVLELRDQQQEQQQPVKKSPLSVAARSKVVNKSSSNYLSENHKNYGPCSYSGCPWPASVPCRLDINIEGINRKWARMRWNGSWLPGYWEPGNFNSDQLSRRSLIVSDVDQSRRVLPLLSNDSVYTINMIGVHCAEDAKFCNVSMDIIRKGIAHHESGNTVDKDIMLDSDISKWSRYVFKAGAAIGASFINPGAAIAIGASTWGLSRAIQENCDSPQGKRFWGTVSDVGQEGILGGISKGVSNKFPYPDAFPGASNPNKLINTVRNFVEPIGGSLSEHYSIHLTMGYYDPNCPLCKK